MSIHQQTINSRVSRLCILIAFTLILGLGCFREAVAQWTTTGNDISNSNSGNVGVGASSPGVKLDVLSSINLIARFGSSSAAHSQVIIDSQSAYNSNLTLQRAGVSKWFMGNRAANDRLSFIESTGNVEVLAMLQNGKVGVGTTAPTAQFHIMTASGDGEGLRIHRNANTAGWGVAQFFTLNNSSGVGTDYGQISGGITSNTAGSESGVMAFYTRNSGSLAERMRISNTGNVGIGTTSPQDPLHIFGTANDVGAIRLQGGNTVAGFIGVWEYGPMLLLSNNRHPGTNTNFKTTVPGSMILVGTASAPGDISFYTTSTGTTPTNTELVRMKANGTVGIGTASPNYKLDVQGGSINTSQGLCFNGDCKTSWSQVSSQWATSGSTISYSAGSVGIGIISPVYTLDVNGGANGFRAKAASASANDTIATFENSSAIKMIVRANGYVGIGTTSPAKPLDVVGDVNASGTITATNIKANYQDLAEWVESSQELSAGTVVILDPTNQIR